MLTVILVKNGGGQEFYMIVCFCGHREVYRREWVSAGLDKAIALLISEGASKFLLGGYGSFDALAARAVYRAKKDNPGLESILVIPYPDRKYDADLYDRTLYPALEHVPRRYAISKRNEYMVDVSDVILAYVTHDWGGAAQTLDYARRKKKRIMMLNEKH